MLLGGRDRRKLDAYFRAVAAMSAGMPDHKTLYDAANIDRNTAITYDSLLDDLFIAEEVPAWAVNHLDRLIRGPKRYVLDASLMAAVLGAEEEAILDSDDLLGRTIDTFVMAQLRPEVALAPRRVRLYHARTKGGREEVDIIAEMPGSKLIGIEVKATASPSPNDARHLRWLRENNPKHFIAGVVFHTGPDVMQFDESIFAVPICAFWG
jgi:predicted AAA+ superfamily ATPase